ncbi:MAG: CCA tRNA nucleotidyltransferase [Bacteroidales bacterium]|nr:CCA tRNA nucleotidyltransferase [Bacteroidales bacterium]
MTEREFAIEVVARLQKAGHQAFWAGGCVRDELLGLPPADYDIATNAHPERVQELFKRSHGFGASFGVVEVLGPRGPDGVWLKVQVATFRSDGTYSDGRRPDHVVFSSPEEDAARRDFTINGLFYDPVAEQLFDFVGGKADIDARILRAIGDPSQRFAEDKLRILRAVRMAARFQLQLDPDTFAAARRMVEQVAVVSSERIAEELRKILVHHHRVAGLQLIREFGLLEPILPELVCMIGIPQGLPTAPTGDLWDHTLRVIAELRGSLWPEPAAVSFPLAFATLLHDIGKPGTFARTPDRYTFHHHEHLGGRIAASICKRLRLSNAESDRIVWLVQHHQYLADAPIMRLSRLKPILIHPGIGELLALHRADALATGKSTDHVTFCEKLLEESRPEDLNPAPLFTGDDLRKMGLPPSPEYKRLLDAAREAQLEGTIRTHAQAAELIRHLLDSSHTPHSGGPPLTPS